MLVGKPLTNRKIAEYQRLGKYGPDLMLPPKANAHKCDGCGSKVTTRKADYAYLPKPGYWCQHCRAKHRNKAEDEKQQARQQKEKEYECYV